MMYDKLMILLFLENILYGIYVVLIKPQIINQEI